MSEIENSEERLKKDLAHYRRVIFYMESNVPIKVLCLPKPIENVLTKAGCLRIYDLINRDFRKIKGLGDRRIDLLTSRLDEFLSISI